MFWNFFKKAEGGPADHLAIGRKGERIAAAHLKRNGYRILARNHSTPFGEIDLICRKKDLLVFVEIKTRTSDMCGYPEEAVGPEKRRRICRAAQAYIQQGRLEDRLARFDVVAVEWDQGRPVVEHIPGAFDLGAG